MENWLLTLGENFLLFYIENQRETFGKEDEERDAV
jgi:hypothetical protein